VAVYVFRCLNCGAPFESKNINTQQPVFCCAYPMLKRDYRAEGVGFSIPGRAKERRYEDKNELRDLFLPTAEEFISPDDPDGSKGIDHWNETHVPAEGNTNPIRPERPLHSRKSFPVS